MAFTRRTQCPENAETRRNIRDLDTVSRSGPPVPINCSRWTAEGLGYLLQECGFEEKDIQVGSWGNRSCVKRNLRKWRKRGFFGSLKNEPDYPVMVWAFAKKSERES